MKPDTPRRVRLSDIAKRAECSVAAVSHALTGSGGSSIRLSSARTDLIRRLAAEMGYRPNLAAQQLAGKKSGILGFVTDQLLTATHSRMSGWLQSHATEQGLHVLIVQTGNKIDKLREAVQEFSSRGIDGIIYNAYMNDPHWAEASEVLASCPHVVSVFGRPPIRHGQFVDVDVAEGMRRSVVYLAEQGRSKMVFIRASDHETCWSKERVRGFNEANRQLGRKAEDYCILQPPSILDWDIEGIDDKVSELIDELISTHKADAVITDDTVAGMLASGVLRDGRIRVPDDLAIVGHRNDVTVHFTYPRLTTVDIMVSDVMQCAVDLLVPNSGSAKSQIIVPDLIVRDST